MFSQVFNFKKICIPLNICTFLKSCNFLLTGFKHEQFISVIFLFEITKVRFIFCHEMQFFLLESFIKFLILFFKAIVFFLPVFNFLLQSSNLGIESINLFSRVIFSFFNDLLKIFFDDLNFAIFISIQIKNLVILLFNHRFYVDFNSLVFLLNHRDLSLCIFRYVFTF